MTELTPRMRRLAAARAFSLAPDAAVTAVLIVAGLSLWSENDAGYAEIVWYPVGLLVLLLGVTLAWATPERPLDRVSAIAVGAFAAFTAWAFLSILWAGDRGLALTGANRTLIYLVTFVVVVRRRWSAFDALGVILAWAAATTALGYLALLRADDSGGSLSFLAGRFSSPVQYANANAAMFVLAAWPCFVAAAQRRLPWLVRALALGVACAAVELAMLAQSKGAALAVAVTLPFVIAIVRERARHLLPMAAAAVVVVAFHRPLLNVYTQLNLENANAQALLHNAATAIAASFACATIAGALFALIGEPLVLRWPGRAQLAGRVLIAAAAATAALSLLVALAHFGGPREAAHRAWHAFTHPGDGSPSSHFLSTAGNHRYDFWRVAASQFRDHPLTGAGVDNYAADYVQNRRSDEQPTYPHSLEARLLGGTGLVGTLLFAIFLGAALWRAVAAARSRTGSASAIGTAALAMLAYWFTHGSVDWLWEFPGVTAPVLVAVAVCPGSGDPLQRAAPDRVGRVLKWAAGGAAVAAIIALGPAWLAARDVAVASSSWRSDVAGAYAALDQAAGLNRLSDQPYVVKGTIAERTRDWESAQSAFGQALVRDPQNWYSQLELGIAMAMQGHGRSAVSAVERAHVLNPRESLISDTLVRLRAHKLPEPSVLDRQFVIRTPLGRAR